MSTEQEYDEQADMLDEDPSDQSAGPGPFPQTFPAQQQSMQPPMQPPIQPPAQNAPFTSPNTIPPAESGHAGAVFNGMNHLYDPYDPMLDADPFGLSASMHFPTLYESR